MWFYRFCGRRSLCVLCVCVCVVFIGKHFNWKLSFLTHSQRVKIKMLKHENDLLFTRKIELKKINPLTTCIQEIAY